MKKSPRILIAAPASGAGKTMITCGLLSCLKERNMEVTAFKCGPDYIDPMFHKEVLGIDSYNLDTFLCGEEGVRDILIRHTETVFEESIAVIEGVMGYYDGLGGISVKASTYDVARATDTPVVLLVDCKGLSVSVIPLIQGFLGYREKNHIKGVILNRLSPGMYDRMKHMIEEQTSVKVYGYVPVMAEFFLESRHLGLKLPCEKAGMKEQLLKLGKRLEETVDIDGLKELAEEAPRLQLDCKKEASEKYNGVRIGVAKDEAFCFLYEDNLEYLRTRGAELVPFSPLYDTCLPEKINGLIFYGGYPELYGQRLSENQGMKRSIKKAIEEGIPCIAECGGFLYLQEELEDDMGQRHSMAGVLKGGSRKQKRLKRFGYLTLEEGTVFGEDVGTIPAHEFHYYDSDECGSAFTAKKPLSERTWKCMISTDTMLAGYPHLHYFGNKKVAEAFLRAAEKVTF